MQVVTSLKRLYQ